MEHDQLSVHVNGVPSFSRVDKSYIGTVSLVQGVHVLGGWINLYLLLSVVWQFSERLDK